MSDAALVVDIRNALYRSIYAVKHDRRPGTKHHYFVAFLKQMATWIRAYRPSSIHICWDAPKETVWRRRFLPTYKERDADKYIEDIGAELAALQVLCKDVLSYMGVRQYSRTSMEADDLIYAFCAVRHPQSSVIISSDSDLVQIPFMMSSAIVYDPSTYKEAPIPDIHPAVQKALKGDDTDKVPGYDGIGPVKSAEMLRCPERLQTYLDTADRRIFTRNLLLIDLSLCPKLLDNQLYVRRRLAQCVQFDPEMVKKLILQHKIVGLQSEFTNLVMPFEDLVR